MVGGVGEGDGDDLLVVFPAVQHGDEADGVDPHQGQGVHGLGAQDYPANYGFIPRTYGDDGDPLDVLVLCSESMDPLTLVRAYPIGYISMLDGGRNDEKIIAIPFADPTYNTFHDLMDLPPHVFDEMAHFFTVYKSLEGKEAVAGDVNGRDAAVRVIQQAMAHYDEVFAAPSSPRG